MDCAKGINFLLTSGGVMRDYRGYGKAGRPMLPMVGIPTTAGTGSEAQSYALITDAETHVKMACGDPGAAFKVAILDPALTLSQPAIVTASAGFDAISHAVESYVSTKRSPASEIFSLQAWRLLEANYERVIRDARNLEARSAMLLGAYWAGLAIENSMLGAAHACANPLTAAYDTEHGIAIGLMLPHVVRWNGPVAADRYAELMEVSFVGRGQTESGADAGNVLARRLEQLLQAGGLPRRLSEAHVPHNDLERLAGEAATQWTGQFNPRVFGAQAALELYERAY
jgi:alcohol dehydrogenase